MRAQLSNRDYEQLSAYIDGQLAPGERRRLEERIHNQPELQNALDELDRTRALLRQAPHRHAPRNFTLTPEMIGEANLRRKRSRGGWTFNLFPILSFTSALAALALVAVLIFQLLPGGRQAGLATAQQPAAPQTAQDSSGTGAVGAAPMNKSAAEPTQAAALMAAEPTQAALRSAEPTPAAQPAAGAAAESQAAGAAPAAAAPEGASAKTADSGTGGVPPVVAWNGAPPFGSQATGMGGGGGDGSSLPLQGSLLGPPAANNTYGTVPSGQDIYGLGGGGGGTGASPLTGPVNLPAESVNSLANNDAARAANPPASVNNNIQGAGPILGVAQAGQGGQIIDQRALNGSPDAATPPAATPQGESATPGNQIFMPGISNGPGQGSNQPETAATPGVSLPVIEGLLALIALAAGGAAFYLWRKRR